MGAVVGGLYSAGVTPQHIEQEFTDKNLMSAYLTVPLSLRLLLIPILYSPRLIGFKPYDGLYRGKKFANYLNKQVPETERNIEDLKIPFGAVAVNLLDGKCKTITHGNLGKALQASAAIPALRKPVKLDDGGLYVDGAVLVNIPVAAARKMGGDVVIAEDFHSVGSVGHRVVSLHMDKINQSELAQADYIIQPDLGDIGLISTSKADARTTISAGETAARRAIPAIRELLEAKSKN
jgi:NTE family protein